MILDFFCARLSLALRGNQFSDGKASLTAREAAKPGITSHSEQPRANCLQIQSFQNDPLHA